MSLFNLSFNSSSLLPNLKIFFVFLLIKPFSGLHFKTNNFISPIFIISPLSIYFFIPDKKYDNLNIEDIKNKIYNTPYLSQLCILNNYLTRINSIDLFIRKCSPNYGIINNETILNIENKNIEDLNSVFFGVVKN